ncbi:MAG: IPT/TIG domain-containing protein [Solirubrobacteraceae bacterium]
MDERARRGEAQRTVGGRALRAMLAGAVALALMLAAASSSLASTAFQVQRLCGAPRPGDAECLGMKLVPASPAAAALPAEPAPQAGEAMAGSSTAVTYKHPFPGYLTAQSLHAAYSLPTETASSSLQTIALIDAYDDPSAEADLAVYDETFGLPPCTSANGCFRKIDQEGRSSPLPPEEGEWAGEISIDVQMAHAVCQSCRILLVEADNEEFVSLGAALDAAVDAGATEISNSYAGPEEPALAGVFAEYNEDYYDHPGLVITASSGDCGYLNEACRGEQHTANFPADSPDVVAIGGTELAEAGGSWSSTVWDEGGSGCSGVFAAPLWQSNVSDFSATGCASERSVADIAAVADPESGVDVYDSTREGHGSPTGWGVWGGTSVASPIVAAEFALAGGSHGVPYPAATVYSHAGDAAALYDVVSGSNGTCGATDTACHAAVGFDGPSGVGSPVGLGAFAIPGAPASASPPSISGITEVGHTLKESAGSWSGGVTSVGLQWARCNSGGSGCAAIVGATAAKYALTAADAGATIRVQETASNAAGAGAPAASAQTASVGSNLLAVSAFTPASGITGSSVTIEGSDLTGAGEVQFGRLAAKFTVLSSTQIEATVPDGALTAPISVKAGGVAATSAGDFRPTLSVTSFKPASAKPGKTVSIAGVGFNKGSTVSFDGQAAELKSVSAMKL